MTLDELVLALLLCLLHSRQKLIYGLRLLARYSDCDRHNVLLWMIFDHHAELRHVPDAEICFLCPQA